MSDIEERLKKKLDEHKNEPWFVAGFESAVAILKPEIATRDKDLSHFRALSTALKLQLVGRGSIDIKEEEIIPVWLRNLNLSRSQQWHITIQFELTYEAKLLSRELKILKIEPSIFTSKIDRLYKTWGKDFHSKKLDTPGTEAEWTELFEALGMHERLEKLALRALLDYESASNEERRLRSKDFKRATSTENDKRGFLIIKNIAWKAECAEMKRHIQSQNVTVYDLIHLMTDATEHVPMQPAGIIVVHVDNIENVSFVSGLPSKYCAPGETPEILEKIYFEEN